MASSQGFHEAGYVDGGSLAFPARAMMMMDRAVRKADGLVFSGDIAGEVLFADVLLLPNGMSKVGVYTHTRSLAGFLSRGFFCLCPET